jgi:hypothetical protein
MNSYKIEIQRVTNYDVIIYAYTEDEAVVKALAIPSHDLPAPSYDNTGISWIESNDK